MSGERKPTSYADDLSIHRVGALTKAEHDFIVEKKGRPVTQDGLKRRYRSSVHPNGTGITSRSNGGKE